MDTGTHDPSELGARVQRIVAAVAALAPRFAHQGGYLDALSADLAAWADSGFAKPDFAVSLELFRPERDRRDGVEHLVVFPMYLQNASRDTRFEALIVRVPWPDWVAELEAHALRQPEVRPGHVRRQHRRLRLRVRRPLPGDRLGGGAPGGEPLRRHLLRPRGARFRRVVSRASEILRLDVPPDAAALLCSPGLSRDAYVLWDLIHDRAHRHGDLPFDPFMIRQRMPYWMYSLEELRCDLTAFGQAVKLEREGFAFARHVQYAILFDRLFRFPITGARVRNYDGLGGQLLFAYLHKHGYLHWTDNRLSIEWKRVADGVAGLREEVEIALPGRHRPVARRPLGDRARARRPLRAGSDVVEVDARRAALERRVRPQGLDRPGRGRRVPALDLLLVAQAQARRSARYCRGVKPFASDNWAPAHPAVLEAIARANEGAAHAYGEDPWTEAAGQRFREHFGERAAAFPVFNGTGANVIAVRALCRPYQGVICAETAHLNVDECGAAEAIAGVKLLTVATPDGKLTPDLVDTRLTGRGDEHRVQPRLISITQATELGTVYTPDELRALAVHAHENGLLLHVDGARVANAAAGLGAGLSEAVPGADVLSFGATKNGALGAEAVVFLTEGLAGEALYLRKQSLQLASKMRFISAQLEAILTDDLWRENAGHANAMATRLASAISGVPGVTISRAVESNAVFAILPPEATAALQESFDFYVWDELTGEVRWMCSWDTTEADVDAFAAAIAGAAGP